MKTWFIVARVLFGITGIIQLILGILFWFGLQTGLVPLHMTVGGIFILSIWALSALGIRAWRALGLAAVAIAWSVLLAAVGMIQTRLLPGPDHWVIRVLHLLMAVVAMGLGGVLTVRLRDLLTGTVHGGQTVAPREA